MLEGHKLNLQLSIKKEPSKAASGASKKKKQQKEEDAKQTKLVVRNVAFEASSKDVRALFQPFGQVKSVRLPRKFDNSHRYGLALPQMLQVLPSTLSLKVLTITASSSAFQNISQYCISNITIRYIFSNAQLALCKVLYMLDAQSHLKPLQLKSSLAVQILQHFGVIMSICLSNSPPFFLKTRYWKSFLNLLLGHWSIHLLSDTGGSLLWTFCRIRRPWMQWMGSLGTPFVWPTVGLRVGCSVGRRLGWTASQNCCQIRTHSKRSSWSAQKARKEKAQVEGHVATLLLVRRIPLWSCVMDTIWRSATCV